MELDGLEITVETIRAIGNDLDRELARILTEVGQPRVPKMKNRTPVDDGHLQSSVFLKPAKRTRQGVEVGWGAGGDLASDYALVQHEDLTFKHTVGQAKYISSVIYEDANAMKSEIEHRIANLFKKYSV